MTVNQVKITYFALIFQLLTSHYEQRSQYYLMVGELSHHSLASEEELHLSQKLFWSVFKAMNKKVNYTKYLSTHRSSKNELTV